MERRKAPVCGTCLFMRVTGRAICNRKNSGKPRGKCYCQHPRGVEVFQRECPKSPREPGFIGFTPMGGDKPKIKTSPHWCPFRVHRIPVERTEKEE